MVFVAFVSPLLESLTTLLITKMQVKQEEYKIQITESAAATQKIIDSVGLPEGNTNVIGFASVPSDEVLYEDEEGDEDF